MYLALKKINLNYVYDLKTENFRFVFLWVFGNIFCFGSKHNQPTCVWFRENTSLYKLR